MPFAHSFKNIFFGAISHASNCCCCKLFDSVIFLWNEWQKCITKCTWSAYQNWAGALRRWDNLLFHQRKKRSKNCATGNTLQEIFIECVNEFFLQGKWFFLRFFCEFWKVTACTMKEQFGRSCLNHWRSWALKTMVSWFWRIIL